jgi:hypothetical protein
MRRVTVNILNKKWQTANEDEGLKTLTAKKVC